MDLTDGDKVIFLLTASIRGSASSRSGDFMATVKVTPEKKLEAEYRFRWHNTVNKMGMDGGADDDDKNFFSVANKDGSLIDDTAEARANMLRGLRAVAASSPGFFNVHEEVGEWTPGEFISDVVNRGPMHTQLTFEEKPR